MMDIDKEYNENLSAKLVEEEEDYVRDHIQQITNPINQQTASKEILATEGSVHESDNKGDARSEASALRHPYVLMDEEQKELFQRALKLKFQAQGLKSDFFKQGFNLFAQSTVIKYPRVFQSLFYLLKAKREDECEPNTNKLMWKKAKKLLDNQGLNLIDKIIDYQPLGAKDDQYHTYQQLNFIERNIESYYQEDVDSYSSAILGRLMRWIQAVIKLRKEDIVRRKNIARKDKEHRDETIQKEAARKERMAHEIKDAEERFLDDNKDAIEAALAYQQKQGQEEEDENDEPAEKQPPPVMPVFNSEEFLSKWVIDNPPIDIPDEVVEDLDNDWIYNPDSL